MIIHNKHRDIVALSIWNSSHSIFARSIYVIVAIFICYAFRSVIFDNESVLVTLLYLISFFFLSVFWLYVISIPLDVVTTLIFNIFIKGSTGTKKFSITESSITETDMNIDKETTVTWDRVKGISMSSSHIFIRFKLIKYFMIPKREFKSEFEFAQFYADIIRLKESYDVN